MEDTYAELKAVSVLSELDRLGWRYEFAGEDEVKCRCPAHADKTPSCGINIRKKVWKCMAAGCGQSGDFISFIALATKVTRRTVIEFIRQHYSVEAGGTIDPTVVERFHEGIWEAKPLLRELYDRGLTDDSIRRWRIGVDESNRITLPIWNDQKHVVNIRRYRPGASKKDKMRNMRGCGKNRLHPIDQLKYDKIILCGGEIKAYAVADRMNQFGYGAITQCGGEDNWEPEFSERFSGKKVWVCYDIDDGGKAGTSKVAARLRSFASWVGDLTAQLCLNLSREAYPHGDINDFFGLEKRTAEDFLQLINATQEWQLPTTEVVPETGAVIEVHLSESTRAEHARRRIKTRAVITAMDTTPYIVPKDVAVECDRNQPFCINCPVYAREVKDDFVVLTVSPESPAILELVNSGKKTKKDAVREGLGIPPCKSCQFHVKSHYNIEDTRVSPQLEISSRHSDSVMLPAMTVSHGLEMNVAYELVGRLYPHPRSQQAVLLISEATPAEDALNTYKPSDEALEELEVFQPASWTV